MIEKVVLNLKAKALTEEEADEAYENFKKNSLIPGFRYYKKDYLIVNKKGVFSPTKDLEDTRWYNKQEWKWKEDVYKYFKVKKGRRLFNMLFIDSGIIPHIIIRPKTLYVRSRIFLKRDLYRYKKKLGVSKL